MVDVSPFTRLRKWFSFNRLAILSTHYQSIKDETRARNAKEREEVAFFTAEFERYSRKAERLAFYRVMLYIFLYATFAVSILKVIPLLDFLVPFIELGGALVGGGIAFVLILLLNMKIDLHIQRMQACMAHLAAFYHQNPKRDTKRALERMSKAI